MISELTSNAENLKASVGHLNLKVDYYNRKDKKKEKLKLHDCNFQDMLDDADIKKTLQRLEEQAKIVIESRSKKNGFLFFLLFFFKIIHFFFMNEKNHKILILFFF